MSGAGRTLWVDASAGVAGDMLLAALLDAGAPLDACQAAVDAVVPGTVRLHLSEVTRAGLRAAAVRVELLVEDQPHRRWATIRGLLEAAGLDDRTRSRALAAFGALARAEAEVHGVVEADVHFHEVGAWDCVADVVAVCAALEALGVAELCFSEVALGSGSVTTQHGTLPVPAPAVLALARGWAVTAGGRGELATPTGLALLTSLAAAAGPLPALTVEAVGVGAGGRDRPDRPNVVRVVLGRGPDDSGGVLEEMFLVETTVDDLDPRVWPTVVADLLAAGAQDAWLTPVLMKKGRPGHVLSVLADADHVAGLRTLVLHRTTALGVRQSLVRRDVLARSWVDVDIDVGGVGARTVAVKVGHRDGLVVHATAEFDDAACVAAALGRGVLEVLEAATAAAVRAGLVQGAPLPSSARPERRT